jgi:hypothetical protein
VNIEIERNEMLAEHAAGAGYRGIGARHGVPHETARQCVLAQGTQLVNEVEMALYAARKYERMDRRNEAECPGLAIPYHPGPGWQLGTEPSRSRPHARRAHRRKRHRGRLALAAALRGRRGGLAADGVVGTAVRALDDRALRARRLALRTRLSPVGARRSARQTSRAGARSRPGAGPGGPPSGLRHITDPLRDERALVPPSDSQARCSSRPRVSTVWTGMSGAQTESMRDPWREWSGAGNRPGYRCPATLRV